MNIKFLKVTLIVMFIAIAISAQDNIKSETIFPGIHYKHIQKGSIPLSIHVVEADLTSKNIGVEVGIAYDAVGKGGETVSSFVNRSQNDSVVIAAAVNGDFFGGIPHAAQNCMVVKGELAKGVVLDRTLFGMLSSGKPVAEKIIFKGMAVVNQDTLLIDALNDTADNYSAIYLNKFYGNKASLDSGSFAAVIQNNHPEKPNKWKTLQIKNILENIDTVYFTDNESLLIMKKVQAQYLSEILEEDSIKIYLGTEPNLSGIRSLIGGLPGLINNGVIPDTYLGKESLKSERFLQQHPRTAVGFSEDSTKLFIVLVDGRQENLSIGIELKKLAEFMLELGCYNAVNLDGGGSSAMVVNNKVVNSPSDKTGERPVHNFLYITYQLN